MSTQLPMPFNGKRPTPFGISDPGKVTDLSKNHFDAGKAANRQMMAEDRVQYSHAGRQVMARAEWAKIEENPYQRNTVKRSATAYHLHSYDPIHQFVAIGRYPDGTLVKIDAHTRCYLWSTGKVAGPETVVVDVFDIANKRTAIALYERFDGQGAAEKGQDRVYSSMRLYELDPQSKFVQSGRFSTALKKLYRARANTKSKWVDSELTRAAVLHYYDQLKFLDSLNVKADDFKVGVTMALLASHKLLGGEKSIQRDQMIEFWTRFAKDDGRKGDGTVDPVQALRESVSKLGEKAKSEDSGGSLQELLFGKALIALSTYLRGGDFKTGRNGGIRGDGKDIAKIYLRGPVVSKKGA